MRVSGKYNGYPTPCEVGFDGEVEDYEVIITPILDVADAHFDLAPLLAPNPTSGQFTIDMRETFSEVEIQVLDLSGRTVQSNRFSDRRMLQMQFDGASGIYFVSVAAEGRSAMFKLLKN